MQCTIVYTIVSELWPLVSDPWMRSGCGPSPSWTSSSDWTRWRNPSGRRPTCYPMCQRFPWTNLPRSLHASRHSQRVPTCQAEAPRNWKMRRAAILFLSSIVMCLFIQAGFVLNMLISSTTLAQVYSDKLRTVMSPQRLVKGPQRRHVGLKEEMNWRVGIISPKLYKSAWSYNWQQCKTLHHIKVSCTHSHWLPESGLTGSLCGSCSGKQPVTYVSNIDFFANYNVSVSIKEIDFYCQEFSYSAKELVGFFFPCVLNVGFKFNFEKNNLLTVELISVGGCTVLSDKTIGFPSW